MDDVVNEVFLGVFRKIDTFEGDASAFRSWLFTIARFKATDAIRAASRRPALVGVDVADRASGDVEADALASLDHEVVDLLDALTDEQREVILLRIVADMSLAQVADITPPRCAVKSIQHRALATLRRGMDQAVSESDPPTMANGKRLREEK